MARLEELFVMKSRAWLLIIIVGVLCLTGWQVSSQQKQTTVWEYKIVEPSSRIPIKEMNDLGAQGWELVTVQFHENSGGADYYFKRAR